MNDNIGPCECERAGEALRVEDIDDKGVDALRAQFRSPRLCPGRSRDMMAGIAQ
jgi:hypothetical protein